MENNDILLQKDTIQCFFNDYAEQSLLGCLFLDWDKMIDVVAVIKSEDFYSKKNSIIFLAMETLFKDNIKCDFITITDWLENQNKMNDAGGLVYITSLTNLVPTASNFMYYVNIVKDRSVRRDILKMGKAFQFSASDMSRKSCEVIEQLEQDVFSLSEKNIESKVVNSDTIITNAMDKIRQNMNNNRILTGIPSGFTKLDYYTSGFQNGEMIVIGARPAMGKTAFAQSMMLHIAMEKRISCGFFSLEMSNESVAQRFLSQMSKVPNNKIRTIISPNDCAKIEECIKRYENAPLYIVDTPNMQLLELRSTARKMKMDFNVKIIFIDYMGLIGTEDTKRPVYEIMSEISKSLKSLARELNIPIVALCQVARDAEGKEPTLAQLRGSGSIEQDADVVMFLHRERTTSDNIDNAEGQEAKCIVAKQRNGATGVVDMLFFPRYVKFENIVEQGY